MLTWLDSFPELDVEADVESNLSDVFRLRTMDDCTLVLMSNVFGSMIPLSEQRPAQWPQATAADEWIAQEPPVDLSWFT